MTISVDAKSFTQLANTAGFFATLFNIKVDQDTIRVLPRDLQLDPVTDVPIHVDFLRVSATTEITVAVPMEFLDEEESEGLRRGGVLNVVRYEVDIVCTPDNLPSSLSVSLAGLDIGDGVHISDVKLPEGVKPAIDDRDFTIATIAAPTIMEEPEEEGAEGGEGELLEEGAEGGEGRGRSGRGVGRVRRRVLVANHHAAHRGPGQSRPRIRDESSQYRFHGGGRNRPPPFVFSVP